MGLRMPLRLWEEEDLKGEEWAMLSVAATGLFHCETLDDWQVVDQFWTN